jgi:putative toxin-antitoxin system antitoxin component (TIGR02293 family)
MVATVVLEVIMSTGAQRRSREGGGTLSDVAELLGGSRVWKRPPATKLEVHDAILRGIPGKALIHVFQNVKRIPVEKLSHVVGVSYRTVQRRADSPGKALSESQGARLWKFAEILNAATELQGTRDAAEQWLSQPAMALDRRTPLDLMATPTGAEMVEDLLTRLKYGVYT